MTKAEATNTAPQYKPPQSVLPKAAPVVLIAIVLGVLTAAVYWGTIKNGFINFDDPDYVTANPVVQAGLRVEGIQWAFTSYHSSNWHPLTWLSHMVDCQLFGMRAGLHHATSVLIHTVSSVLLFLLLRSMTGFVWRSAFVAALFAVHPMHVESVAWVSERKDVLSGLFFMLTVWAYSKCRVQSAECRMEDGSRKSEDGGRRSAFYVLALVCFALGLMSKPMLVTVPFVLLLLDYWPLGRARGDTRPYLRLVVEKVPFFGLAAASCVVTFYAQKAGGATMTLSQTPFVARLGNAFVSYAWYVIKTFWPTDLAVFYPLAPVTTWAVTGALVPLILISAMAFYFRNQMPYLPVGWFWFVGMLVPVIGLVQVGKQSFADRYVYLPHIGLFILLTWGAADILRRYRLPRLAGVIAAATVLACCGWVSARQVPYWRDSKTLFEHAAAVTDRNYVAQAVIATCLVEEGRLEEAIDHCQTALEFAPDYAEAHNTLGVIYSRQGNQEAAIDHFRRAIHSDARLIEGYKGLGDILIQKNQLSEAETVLRQAFRLAPLDPSVQYHLAISLHNQGKLDEAARLYEKVIASVPSLFGPRRYLGNIYAAQGKTSEAVNEFREALRIQPEDAETHAVLGMVLLQQGNMDGARVELSQAVRLAPRNAIACYHLALMEQAAGRTRQAVDLYRDAIAAKPDWPEALNNLAWLMAAHDDPGIRNGAEAVLLAERACALSENQVAVFLGTLGAAYAEAGRFEEAIAAAEKARELALAAGEETIAAKNRELLQQYRERKPARE